jgi:hypothetical protein
MEAMRNNWTDDRLDAFSNEAFDSVQRSMDSLHTAIVELHRMTLRASLGVIALLIAILATQL